MKITEVRKKLETLKNIMSEWSMLDALIKSMDKCHKNGLEINQTYLNNAKIRREKLANKFDDYLK